MQEETELNYRFSQSLKRERNDPQRKVPFTTMDYPDNATKTSSVIWNPIIPLNRVETLNGSSEEATLNYC